MAQLSWTDGIALAGFLALNLAGTASVAHAAGFDCAKAATPTEKAICRDQATSLLDEQVGAAFQEAMGFWSAGNWKDFLRNEQRSWLKVRNMECKADLACLKREYEIRLRFLQRPGLRYLGRYIAGRCGDGGVYLDVTPSYPAIGVEVSLYLCPNEQGNMLFQGSGLVDASGKMTFEDAGCQRSLQFSQDSVRLTNPSKEACMLMTNARNFSRDAKKSPFERE